MMTKIVFLVQNFTEVIVPNVIKQNVLSARIIANFYYQNVKKLSVIIENTKILISQFVESVQKNVKLVLMEVLAILV